MLVLRVVGALAFLVPLGLYLASCGGYPSLWDTGELQTVPFILGIAHPTGFPLFTLVGWVVSHALPVGSVAWRINAMSAAAVAGAAWLVWRVAVRLGASSLAALLGAWWFALGSVVWTHAIRAEVHDLAVLLGALAVACAVSYHLDGDARMVVWSALWLGLGLANHPIAVWLVPGLVILVLARGRALPVRTLLACGGVIVACLVLYAYLPIRSAIVSASGLDPAALLPGMGGGGFLWDYNHPASWRGFLTEVSGSQFGAGATVMAALHLPAYAWYLHYWLSQSVPEFGVVGVLLALFGVLALAVRDWRAAIGIVVAACAAVPFAVAFKDVEGDVSRYFLLSYWMVGVGIGLAVPATWFARGAIPERVSAWATARRAGAWALLIVAMIFAARCLHRNTWIIQSRNDHGAQGVIDTVRAATPGDAVVVSPWLDATALGYAAYVQRSMGRRIIVSAWPEDLAARYPVWLERRPVYLVMDGVPRLPGLRVTRTSPALAPVGVYEVQR